MALSGGRQPVVLRAIPLGSVGPLTADKALLFQAMQCRKQRACFHVECAPSGLPDALSDADAVAWLQRKRLQHQQLEQGYKKSKGISI